MDDLERAVRESNTIEGVPNKDLWLENHLRAVRLCKIAANAGGGQMLKPQVLHAILFEGLVGYLGFHNPGEYRRCGVTVGSFVPPPSAEVPHLMALWAAEEPDMDPWDAHAWFETIHPFPDGNGRVGRLLYWNMQMQLGEPIEIIYAEKRFAYYEQLERWRTANKVQLEAGAPPIAREGV
jgi:hypothetical protein